MQADIGVGAGEVTFTATKLPAGDDAGDRVLPKYPLASVVTATGVPTAVPPTSTPLVQVGARCRPAA